MSFGVTYTAVKEIDENGKKHMHSINGERYVYYQRLFTDNIHPELGEKAKDLFDWRLEVGAKPEQIAMFFKEMRNREFTKEKDLLEKKFGKKVRKYYTTLEDEKHNKEAGFQLVSFFNTTLNLKSMFERNLKLIAKTGGKRKVDEETGETSTTGTQKQLITWFPSYFQKQLELRMEDINKEAANFLNSTASTSLQEAYEEALNSYLPEMVRDALIYMFSEAKTESGIKEDRDRLQQAYKELVPALQNYTTNPNANEFVNAFIDTYNLKELVNSLSESITGNINKTNINAPMKNIKGRVHSLGGGALENLGTFVAKFVVPELGGKTTGSTLQKADMIFTLDIPTDIFDDWLENSKFGTRSKDTLALANLQARLAEFDNGFIIYSNAKNYTLDSNGFHAGESVNLNTWDDMIHNLGIKGRDFIFMIMQLIPNAIGDKKKDEVSMMFARAICSALFDDADVFIDNAKNLPPGPNAIHVLYLNGIYFPLSFYYSLLAQVFHDYAKTEVNNVKSLVNVNFKLPSNIRFPKQTDQEAWAKEHPGESPWREQQQIALDEITISYKFLGAFKNLMKELEGILDFNNI